MNALICKQILALLEAETRDQCPFHWSYLVSVPLPLYLKMAAYQYFLSCLANFGGVFRQTHLGQGQRAQGRWEIWVQTESVSTLSAREWRSL